MEATPQISEVIERNPRFVDYDPDRDVLSVEIDMYNSAGKQIDPLVINYDLGELKRAADDAQATANTMKQNLRSIYDLLRSFNTEIANANERRKDTK